MNKKIAWSVLMSVGLALSACGTVDDGATGTTLPVNDDGTNAESGDAGATSSNPGDTGSNPGDTGVADESGDEGSGDDAPMTTGVGFIMDPDGGGVSFECDIFAQDCPEGEKCMPWSNDGGGAWNATRCSPISDNPGQPGDECTVEGSGTSGIDDCDIGSMCWDVDAETNVGTCVAMCTGDEANPICEDPDTTCSIANDGAIVLCLPACDPLLQDCADGQACYPINDAWACAPDASGEMGAAGDPCEFINVCSPGNICLGAAAWPDCQGSAGCYSPVCDLSDPSGDAQCPGAGQACEPWYEEGSAPPGYEEVGACALPA